MIDRSVVFRKSANGVEALATRDAALSPRLRQLLILVDGRRSVPDLCHLGASLGSPEQLLTELDDLGMIEPASRSGWGPLSSY